MNKPGILAETDPDLAQAGASTRTRCPRREAARRSDKTAFWVFIDGKIVDLRKLEREVQVASSSADRVTLPYTLKSHHNNRDD